jgi:hypothetical protein
MEIYLYMYIYMSHLSIHYVLSCPPIKSLKENCLNIKSDQGHATT